MAKLTKEAFVEALKEMTILEIKELVDGLKEEFGIDPSAVAVAAGPAASAADEGPKEVTVSLVNAGGSKINVIKVVKELTGLGLKEAKELVDKAPSPIKEKITPEEAEAIKAKLEEVGAKVTLK